MNAPIFEHYFIGHSLDRVQAGLSPARAVCGTKVDFQTERLLPRCPDCVVWVARTQQQADEASDRADAREADERDRLALALIHSRRRY